jgi:hypothetical protein
VTFPVFFAVAGMALVSFSLGVALIGLVVRIAYELCFPPFALPGTLAILLAAAALVLHPRIGFKTASAMSALDGPVHGCPPEDDNHNVPHPEENGRAGRKTPKPKDSEIEGFCMRKRKKKSKG